MNMDELLKLAANYGAPIILAVIVLYWKRVDDQRYQIMIEKNMETLSKLQEATTAALACNTAAMQGLASAVDKLGVLERIEARLR